MTTTANDLPAILEAHRLWLRGEGGSRADLSRADLREANLYGADLSRADLSRADLSRANLSRANLSRANLYWANLYGADLREANLYGADLSGADLYGADLREANLSRANLSRANLSGANLYGANLSGANLYGADLSRANLYGADLREANLSRADLSRADLREAKGVLPAKVQPLLMLLDQVGKIRAYKLTTADGYSPMQGRLHYPLKGVVEVDNANTDVTELCAAGVNVATLDWCIKEWRTGLRIMVVEFTTKDIACIPTASDGKFRLHRCKVVGEKDLVALGLIEKKEAAK